MDFCPAYTTIFRFEVEDDVHVLDCTDPELNGSWVQKADEVFGSNSRCIEHKTGARPLCLKIVCGDYGAEAGKVVLVVGGGNTRMKCDYAGQELRLPGGTAVVCPSFEQTCPE